MGAAEKILIAEETIAGVQDHLRTVETVLETAEQVVATGEKAGRYFGRAFRVLLLISAVIAVALVVKKVMGDRCSMGGDAPSDSESSPDTVASDAVDDDETVPAADTDVS